MKTATNPILNSFQSAGWALRPSLVALLALAAGVTSADSLGIDVVIKEEPTAIGIEYIVDVTASGSAIANGIRINMPNLPDPLMPDETAHSVYGQTWSWQFTTFDEALQFPAGTWTVESTLEVPDLISPDPLQHVHRGVIDPIVVPPQWRAVELAHELTSASVNQGEWLDVSWSNPNPNAFAIGVETSFVSPSRDYPHRIAVRNMTRGSGSSFIDWEVNPVRRTRINHRYTRDELGNVSYEQNVSTSGFALPMPLEVRLYASERISDLDLPLVEGLDFQPIDVDLRAYFRSRNAPVEVLLVPEPNSAVILGLTILVGASFIRSRRAQGENDSGLAD